MEFCKKNIEICKKYIEIRKKYIEMRLNLKMNHQNFRLNKNRAIRLLRKEELNLSTFTIFRNQKCKKYNIWKIILDNKRLYQ